MLVFVVEAEDVGVLVVGGGDALLVLHLVDGDDLVAEAGGELELLGLGGLFHARGQARARVRWACLRGRAARRGWSACRSRGW